MTKQIKSRIRPILTELLVMGAVLFSVQAMASGAQLKTHVPEIEVVALSSDGQPVPQMTYTFWVMDQKYGWHGGLDGDPFPQHGWYNITTETHNYATGADGKVMLPAHDIETDQTPYIQGISVGDFTIPECGMDGYVPLQDQSDRQPITATGCEFASDGVEGLPIQVVCKLNATAATIHQAYLHTQAVCISHTGHP